MQGSYGAFFVEAASAAAARTAGGTYATFDAKPILLEELAGDVIGTTNAKKFKVVNTLPTAVAIGDKLSVSRIAEEYFITNPASSTGGRISFEIVEGTAAVPPELCYDRLYDAPTTVTAKILRRPCGVSKVFGEDASGQVQIVDDEGKFLDKREAGELVGKKGFAELLSPPVDQVLITECQWVIQWINWFQERQFEQDWYVSGLNIIEERVNAYVWNWCRLPDEITEGVDCETTPAALSIEDQIMGND